MRSSTRFGIVAGLAAAAAAIANDLLSGDPHLVPVFPDFVSVVAAAAFVSIAVHVAIRSDAGSRAAGLRASIAAGLTFGAAMGLFTLWYLPIHSIAIATLAAATGAILVAMLGALATALHGHRDLMAPSRGV